MGISKHSYFLQTYRKEISLDHPKIPMKAASVKMLTIF